MSTLSKNNFSKLLKTFSLALLFSSAMSSVFAEESDYYQFPTGEQEGGGVRGEVNSCSPASSYPIPLIPQNYKSLTASASPTLFFDTSNIEQAVDFEFLLLNQNDEIVHQDSLKTHQKSGIIGLNLFDNTNSDALRIDDNYHWYLVENCGDADVPIIVGNGSLERIQLNNDLTKQLNNASLIEQIDIYQAANIWHETIENITLLKCNNSDDISSAEKSKDLNFSNVFIESFNNSLDAYCQNSEL